MIVSTSRTPISELPFVIDEPCAINLNSDYTIDSTKHHLSDALGIKRELDLNSSAGCALES